ncbi:hypothetical protein FB451DRAFT_1492422 [Mycena latifolia]|nr:hypothetical protein FB451DRAFT_1492422 [Mycena latifolia]
MAPALRPPRRRAPLARARHHHRRASQAAAPRAHAGQLLRRRRRALAHVTYTALRKWEAALPQHNLALPFRLYVKFSNQVRVLGWNNYFNQVRMRTWRTSRDELGLLLVARALPVVEGALGEHRAAHARRSTQSYLAPSRAEPRPRAVSEDWFDVVCPRYVNTARRQARCGGHRRSSKAPAAGDAVPRAFDLRLWGSPRLLSLWPSFAASPISRLLGPSPIPRHGIAWTGLPFYSWTLVAYLPDRFAPAPAPGRWPDRAGVVRTAAGRHIPRHDAARRRVARTTSQALALDVSMAVFVRIGGVRG